MKRYIVYFGGGHPPEPIHAVDVEWPPGAAFLIFYGEGGKDANGRTCQGPIVAAFHSDKVAGWSEDVENRYALE